MENQLRHATDLHGGRPPHQEYPTPTLTCTLKRACPDSGAKTTRDLRGVVILEGKVVQRSETNPKLTCADLQEVVDLLSPNPRKTKKVREVHSRGGVYVEEGTDIEAGVFLN